MNIGSRHKLCFIFVTLDAAGANVSFVSWLQSLMPANVIVVPYWCAAHQIQRTATRPPRIWLCVSTACLNASRISTHIALIPRSVVCEAHFYLTHPVRQYGDFKNQHGTNGAGRNSISVDVFWIGEMA